jgi:hypothetical protein
VKTKAFFVLVMLALTVSMVIPFATPAMADICPQSTYNNIAIGTSVIPTIATIHNGDAVDYIVEITNLDKPGECVCAYENVVIHFQYPGLNGLADPATDFILADIGSMPVGSDIRLTSADYPALHHVINVNPGVRDTTAHVYSLGTAMLYPFPKDNQGDQKDIPVTVITPCIDVTKTANPTVSKAVTPSPTPSASRTAAM